MASSIALSLHRKYSLISHSSNKKTTFFFVYLPQKIEHCSEFHQCRLSRKAKRVSTRVLGLQHLALMSEDIFRTLREMRKRSSVGGFEFTPSPLPTPYRNLKAQVGDVLMNKQIKEELINDPVVKLLTNTTEEGQKVAGNGGQTFQAVSRRIAPSL